jgi:heat-inducible transcriptional repressor
MELSYRAKQILYAVISEFVATGEPVGSRTLSKKAGIDLSPASIRNVLADLDELGYLVQPHTSAGRVPTDKAFRLFIDALMHVQQLSAAEHARIRAHIDAQGTASSGRDVIRETGKLLSDLTGTAAVVVVPRSESATLRTLRFVPVGQELLAVIVMSNGAVQNKFVGASATEQELVPLHNLLDDVIEGRTLRELRDLFARRLATERVREDAMRKRAFELGEAAVAGIPAQQGELVIEGQAKLLEQPEFKDAQGMKQVMNALDAPERVIALLDATITAGGAAVVVGSEAGDLGGGHLSIVGAAYTDHGQRAGALGVIGPTRMDYPKVLPLVAATANAMSAIMDSPPSTATSLPEVDDDDPSS